MINILFIAYEFPPLNEGGSNRPLNFVNNLRVNGINPIVITPEIDNNENIDYTLLEQLDKNIEVIRVPKENDIFLEKFFSKNYINIQDTVSKKWEKHLLPVLERLTKEVDFQAMYVTAPPFSMANLGVEISKKFNLPLILDMRDHWSHWNITPFTSYLHYQLILRKEREWFTHVHAVLAVTEQMVEDFKNIHPHVDSSKFHTVRNSYAKYIKIQNDSLLLRKPTKENPLKIGYVGSFYYHPYQRDLIFNPWWKKKLYQWLQYTPRKEDWLYRSPYFFFKTLQQFIKLYPDLSELIKVEFIGAKPDWLIDMVKEFELENHVLLKGFLPHAESITFQQSCDALLGTSMKVINGRDYCIAGKSYEYIAQQKPILAFMTEGSQKDFFEASGISLIFDADDTEKNVELLKSFVLDEIDFTVNKEFIAQISTKETTRKLANIIKEVIEI